MTFYQELQLNQAGSKNLLKKSETLKEKLYHMWVYLVKIAATMAFCFFFVSIFSILFGNENSIAGVVVLLCLMVFRNADLGIRTGQSTMLLALFFVIMTVCPHLANQFHILIFPPFPSVSSIDSFAFRYLLSFVTADNQSKNASGWSNSNSVV